MFNIGDLKKCEDNTELGTILLEEGGNDPDNSPQTKISQGEHMDKQPSELIVTDWMTTLAVPTDLRSSMSNMQDQLQTRPNISNREGQGQEEPRKSLTETFKQGKSSHTDQQTTEQQIVSQSSLHNVKNPSSRMGEHGNLENGISIHGPRSQGPRTLLIVLTEAANLVARSPAHQFYNMADT